MSVLHDISRQHGYDYPSAACKRLIVQAKSQELASCWAEEVVALSKAVDGLIQRLPDTNGNEDEELAKAAAAIEEHNRVGAELRAETELTEKMLAHVRSLFAALADAELEARSRKTLQEQNPPS